MNEMKETAPTIRYELTGTTLEIGWDQQAQPAVEAWMLYVGTKAKTTHPEGGFQWEICNASMKKETHESIPLGRLPKGREIYMQVGGITNQEEVYSNIISTSIPKELEEMTKEQALIKTVVEGLPNRPAEAILHDGH